MDCVFCSIVSRTTPAHLVWEDDTTLAFLDINPAADGHVLVIPKIHASDIFDIEPDSIADVARTVHRVANLLKTRLEPEGITLFQANGSAGWQDIFHLHVHVVPRASDDQLTRPWHSVPDRRDRLEEMYELLR